MPKAKVVYSTMTNYDYDGCDGKHVFLDGVEWEEVSDEDLRFLQENVYNLPRSDYLNAVVVVQKDESIPEALTSLKKWVAEEKARKEAEEKARIAAKEAKKIAAEARKLKLQADSEEALLDEIIKNNPELVRKKIFGN